MDIQDFHHDRLIQINEVVDQLFDIAISRLTITLPNGNIILKPDVANVVLHETQALAVDALNRYDHEHIPVMIESINQAHSYKDVKNIFKDALIKIGE